MTEVNLLPEEGEKRSFFKNYASLLPKVNLVITVIFCDCFSFRGFICG